MDSLEEIEKNKFLKKHTEIILIPKKITPDIEKKIFEIKHVNEGIISLQFIEGFSHEKYFQRISISYNPELCFIMGYRNDIIGEIKKEIKELIRPLLIEEIKDFIKQNNISRCNFVSSENCIINNHSEMLKLLEYKPCIDKKYDVKSLIINEDYLNSQRRIIIISNKRSTEAIKEYETVIKRTRKN